MSRSRGIEWALAALALTFASPALGQDWGSLIRTGPAVTATPAGDILLLEVWINGRTTDLIATVEQRAGGRLFMMDDELEAVGLSAQDHVGLVAFADLAGVKARYDEDGQRLVIEAHRSAMLSQVIDLRAGVERAKIGRQPWGGVVNYITSASAGQGERGDRFGYDMASVALEGRLFGPFGSLASATTTTHTGAGFHTVRLDTTFSHYDPDKMREVRAGDLINGGFDWTRPIRMGGVQLRRNFATRPDLITMPSPELQTSAAAPSILDLYINGAPVLSRKVGAGPVQIEGLPPSQGYSETRLVLRDETGRETIVTAPFFASSMLLRKGFVDYSAEVGFARGSFGLESGDYGDDILASASVRYGLNDRVTVETHGEFGAGLANLGGGLATRLGDFGAASIATTLSEEHGARGALASAAFDTRVGGIYVAARAQQSFGEYHDLATATARAAWRDGKLILDMPPRSVRQMMISAPIHFGADRSEDLMLSVNYSAQTAADGATRSLVSASARRTFARRITTFVTAYRSSGRDGRAGGFIGISIPFGGTSVSFGAEGDSGAVVGFAESVKTEDQSVGSTAWRLRAEGGARSRLEARGGYRAERFKVEAAAQVSDGAVRTQGQIEGGIAWLGGAPAMANRIDGAFAMVEVGAPGLPVIYRNQTVGISDAHGRVLVRHLQPFDRNLIEIDTKNLDLSLEAPRTQVIASPREGGGVIARFDVVEAAPALLVRLKPADGLPMPAGSRAVTPDGKLRFVVGYDGEVFVSGLPNGGALDIDMGEDRRCRADIPAASSLKGGSHAVALVCR